MWERLASMKQEHAMAASQCEYIGESNDKQDDGSIGVEDSVSQLAEAVQEMVQDAIGEVLPLAKALKYNRYFTWRHFSIFDYVFRLKDE